jgi:glucose-6-phosphate 1-dehydrogenase
MEQVIRRLTVVVLGASGDLSHRKIYPALFALYCQGFLPEELNVIGFARTAFGDEQFRDTIREHLTCRYTPEHECEERMDSFLDRCRYFQGEYDQAEDFRRLQELIRTDKRICSCHILFYFAVPSSVFAQTARAIGEAEFGCESSGGWIRAVMEKPFGHDRDSFDALSEELEHVFREDQMYRIDHYLGKEVIQNLMVLRFANLIFEPVWNRLYIEKVEVEWCEDAGVDGRGGYFDSYGIIRDVMQNHLLQIVALMAMEQPLDIRRQVRDEKMKLLKAIRPVTLKHCVLGQYGPGNGHEGYTEDRSVPDDSRTPTYAECLLQINNRRWADVPFVLLAAKGVNRRETSIRVKFRAVPANPFETCDVPLQNNELVLRVQPDEQIYLRIQNKRPGLDWRVVESDLNLNYQAAFDQQIPDAYESLLLDVIRGDRSLFIRRDELEAAWNVFTPLLHEIEAKAIRPEGYLFGSAGPERKFKESVDL